jgi:hypothetical protein
MDIDSADWAIRVQRLEAEVTGLHRGLRHRALIEQAKGVLSERLGIDVEQAFQHLVRTSQRTNIRVVDVAADVLAAAHPDEDPPTPEVGRRRSPAGPTRSPNHHVDQPRLAAPTGLPAGLRRSLTRLRSAITGVDDPDEFIGIVFEEVATALGVRAVGLHLARPDGGHRLLAARGWPRQVVSDWRAVPSAVRTPAAEALRRNEILVLPEAGSAELTLIGPGAHRAVLPVPVGTSPRPVAAVELVWSEAVPWDEGCGAFLGGVADLVAGWLGSTKHGDDAGHNDDTYTDPGAFLAAVVEAAPIPACAVSPLWDSSGHIVDLVVEHLNPTAAAHWGPAQHIGRRLLDLEPALVGTGALSSYAEAYNGDGRVLAVPGPAGPATASRVGRWLVLVWSGPDPRATTAGVATVERLGGFGFAEWSADGVPLVFSAGLNHLLGRDATHPPVSLGRLVRLVEPEDRPQLESAVRRARAGLEASTQFGVHTPAGGVRVLGVVAAPGPDDRSRIITLFQDVTDTQRRDAAATQAAQRHAEQRMQTAVERAQTEELRAALYPPPTSGRSHGGWRVAARHTAPTSINQFRGDFYEVMTVDGALVIVVGDVFGSGVQAANAMVRLRHSARVLLLAGLSPARTLHLINQELAGDAEPPLASAVVARLEPGEVTWAQAGHYSPVLVHDGRGRSLRRPRGDALGLIGDARYTESSVRLVLGDGLVMFTDGVLNRDGGSVTTVRRLVAEVAEASSAGGSDEVVRRFPRATQDEACVVAADWSG